MKESLLFLKRWLTNPLRLGTCFPSSKALGRLMAKCVKEEWNGEDDIIELGAGTGRFTRALLEGGIPQERIIAFELDKELASYLRKTFPGITVIEGNACFMKHLLQQEYSQHRAIGVVASGLPMLAFPKIVKDKIMTESFDLLREGGSFVQFTYSPFSSVNCERFGLLKKQKGWILGNFPPANVWAYKKCA